MPPASTDVTLYPHPRSVLADAPAADGAPLRFAFDPAEPTPTIGGRLLMGSAAGYRDDSAPTERADVLTFTVRNSTQRSRSSGFRFRQGHRIRLTIAGGSIPRFARNLGTDSAKTRPAVAICYALALDPSGVLR